MAATGKLFVSKYAKFRGRFLIRAGFIVVAGFLYSVGSQVVPKVLSNDL